MSILQARGLAVRLGAVGAIDGIDLTLQPGRLAVLIGPNGAGKTTLLKALAGLQAPSEGAVTLDGVPVARLPARERARRIAYLPQGGTIAWPLSVADVVALGRLPHGEAPDRLGPEGAAAVGDALRAVGLMSFAERPATTLSGGERARVLLARALATDSPVLLADEPVAALDPRHQLRVLEILRERAAGGRTVLCILHDLSLAARFADDLIVLRAGRTAAAGSPPAVLTPQLLAEIFGIHAEVTPMDGRPIVTPLRPLEIDD